MPALSKMTSFLLEMGDIFRQDGSLMSVCSLRPAESAAELSHAETSPLSQICETLPAQQSNQIDPPRVFFVILASRHPRSCKCALHLISINSFHVVFLPKHRQTIMWFRGGGSWEENRETQ